MPTYLSELSEADPADAEVVSQGASRIRDLTKCAKLTMDVEHTQTGEHQFPIIQPGTPTDGQIWFDLVNKVIRRTNGTAHDIANAVGITQVHSTTIANLTTTYASIADLPGVVVHSSSRVILGAFFQCTDNSIISAKWIRDAANVSTKVWQFNQGSLSQGYVGVAMDYDVPTAGTYTYHIQAKASLAIVTSTWAVALVL